MSLRAILGAKRYAMQDLWFACAVLSWLGWIKVSGIIATFLGNTVVARSASVEAINAWASVPEQYKIVSFFEYAIEIAGALVLGLIALVFFSRRRSQPVVDESKTVTRNIAFSILALVLIVNIAVVRFGGVRGIALWLALAVVMGFALVRESTTLRIARLFGWTIPAVASIAIIVFAVVPAINGKVVLKNDYMEIPGKTLLSDGRTVVNQAYINQNHLDGFAIPDIMAPEGQRVDLSRYPHIEAPDNDFIRALSSRRLDTFYYQRDTHTLYVHSNTPPAVLTGLQADAPDEDSAKLMKALKFASAGQAATNTEREPDAAQADFIAANRYELAAQVQLGRFFYHHTYFFGPILDYSLGIPAQKYSMLYGFGSTVSLAHLLHSMGGVTLDHYFTVFYASYLIYALMVVAIAGGILSDRRYLFIILAGVLGFFVLPGYEDFLQAPGFNPLRHAFDFLVFLGIFGFLRTRNWILGLALAACTVIAVWWSSEFGVLSMISVVAAMLCAGLSARQYRVPAAVIGVLTVAGTLAMMGYLHRFAAPNPTAVYSLIGVSMPVTDSHFVDLAASLVMLTLVGVIGLLVHERASSARALSLASVGMAAASYFVASLMYVVWYPSPHHLAPIFPSLALAIACLSKAMLVDHQSRKWEDRILAWTPALLTLVLLPALVLYGIDYRHYQSSSRRHVVYTWPFDTLKARTTMDPEPFQRAVDLIHKYDPSHRIVLISKYSHLLPLLAGSFNDVGLPELESTLVTHREESIVEDAVRRSGKRYIFVDSTIDDPTLGEIPDSNGVLSKMPGFVDEAKGRVLALSVLRDVFNDIRSQYRLVETTPVISVYERIGNDTHGAH